MLDAYIIDRIRKERLQEQEKRDGAFVALHMDAPVPEEREPDPHHPSDDPERGTTTIDFRL